MVSLQSLELFARTSKVDTVCGSCICRGFSIHQSAAHCGAHEFRMCGPDQIISLIRHPNCKATWKRKTKQYSRRTIPSLL